MGLAAVGAAGGACACILWSTFLPRSRPHLGHRPDARSTGMLHWGQLIWAVVWVTVGNCWGATVCRAGAKYVTCCCIPWAAWGSPPYPPAPPRRPQLGQYLDRAGTVPPHLGQPGTSLAPHWEQNCWPMALCQPQLGHLVICCTL